MLQIEFDLSKFESCELLIISDVHLGNPLCQEHIFNDLVEYIKEEPDDPNMARICLLNGDLTESVTRHSVGNLFEQTMTPSVQVATMIKYLKPLMEKTEKYPQGKILSYCAGNHDGGRYKDTGISAAESIAVGLDLDDRFSFDGCYSFLTLKRHGDGSNLHTTIYNTHLTGSGISTGAKANKISKIGSAIFASVIVGSHYHSPMTFKEDFIFPSMNGKCYLKQNTVTYILSNAFLNYGDYVQRAGMKPGTIAIPKIYLKQSRSYNDRYIYTEVLL